MRLTRKWLAECEALHSECQNRHGSTFTPKRLLRIRRIATKWHVRLIYPRKPCKYTALSYCWGGTQHTTYNSSTKHPWETSGLPWEKLPRTIQDAILVTFVLGVKFIWIDAFCILQDDHHDKETEIAKMPNIYHGAVLTLSAVGMSSVHDGLFRPMRRPLVHAESIFELPVHGAPASCDSALFVPLNQVQVTSLEEDGVCEPLDRRAWTLQESLLSRRLLKFTSSTMRGECQKRPEWDFDEAKKKHILSGYPLHPAICRMRHQANFSYVLRSGRLFCPSGRPTGIPETGIEQPDIYPWHKLVEEYSSRTLSFPQDRALAISGIAEQIGLSTKDQYCAGLWKSCLVNQLGWYEDVDEEPGNSMPGFNYARLLSAESHPGVLTHQWGDAFCLPPGNDCEPARMQESTRRRAETCDQELKAPSWSWISVTQPVRFRVFGIAFTLEIINVLTRHSLEDAPFGNVDFGELTVRGPIKPKNLSGDGGVNIIGNEAPCDATDNLLFIKLGEDESLEANSSEKAICLEIKRKSMHTWVRVGLSATSNNGWSETRTIVLV